jgi:hypothetical protein
VPTRSRPGHSGEGRDDGGGTVAGVPAPDAGGFALSVPSPAGLPGRHGPGCSCKPSQQWTTPRPPHSAHGPTPSAVLTERAPWHSGQIIARPRLPSRQNRQTTSQVVTPVEISYFFGFTVALVWIRWSTLGGEGLVPTAGLRAGLALVLLWVKAGVRPAHAPRRAWPTRDSLPRPACSRGPVAPRPRRRRQTESRIPRTVPSCRVVPRTEAGRSQEQGPRPGHPSCAPGTAVERKNSPERFGAHEPGRPGRMGVLGKVDRAAPDPYRVAREGDNPPPVRAAQRVRRQGWSWCPA